MFHLYSFLTILNVKDLTYFVLYTEKFCAHSFTRLAVLLGLLEMFVSLFRTQSILFPGVNAFRIDLANRASALRALTLRLISLLRNQRALRLDRDRFRLLRLEGRLQPISGSGLRFAHFLRLRTGTGIVSASWWLFIQISLAGRRGSGIVPSSGMP